MNSHTTTIGAPPAAAAQEQAKQLLAGFRQIAQERAALVGPALEALARLVQVCKGGSGQAYVLRKLLFSLWNGKAVDLSDKLRLDWALQKDFAQVLLAFGHDDFFYKAFNSAFGAAGLFDWFTAEGEEVFK